MYCPKCGMYVLKTESTCPNCKLDLTKPYHKEEDLVDSIPEKPSTPKIQTIEPDSSAKDHLEDSRTVSSDHSRLETPGNLWYIMIDKEEGPYSESALIKAIKSGWITGNTKIRPSDLEIWLPISKTKFTQYIQENKETVSLSSLNRAATDKKHDSQEKSKSSAPLVWFIYDGNKSRGPYSESTIKEFITTKKINGDWLIRHSNMTGWESLKNTPLKRYIPEEIDGKAKMADINAAYTAYKNQSSKNERILFEESMDRPLFNDTWLWILSITPIISYLLLFFRLTSSNTFIILLSLAIAIFCMGNDYQTNYDYVSKSWIIAGVFFIPLYLFIRASKTNKNYIPGLTYCILYALSIYFLFRLRAVFVLVPFF